MRATTIKIVSERRIDIIVVKVRLQRKSPRTDQALELLGGNLDHVLSRL